MKRNAFKVKYSKENNDVRGHIARDEYLSEYLSDFPDLLTRFAVVNNHAETILVDKSLQVFTSNNLYRKFDFLPLSKFQIKTKEMRVSSQLDSNSGLMKASNIFLEFPSDGKIIKDHPIGFLGEVIFEDFCFDSLFLCDISHRYNSFGRDIFSKISEIICDVWDEIPDDNEIRSYKPSQVTLGMDAEFELIKGRAIVRAGDYFPFEGEIGTDGHPSTLELRPHYANQSNKLLDNLTQLMQKVYEDHFEIETNGDIEALGAHIHFGSQQRQSFIYLLDNWIAKPLWHLNGKARSGYKHLSQSRNTNSHQGFEYRSLPSGILKDKKLASMVLKIIEGISNDFYINNKEISLHPCKEDYLHYIDENEWKKWREYRKDGDKKFKAESWGCKRKGELYQRNAPGSLELEIPIQVYLYKLREDRGDVFFLSPMNYTIRDYFMEIFKKKFTIENETAEVLQSIASDLYKIGLPYAIHSKVSEYNTWLKNFMTFLNSSALEEIPEL